MTSLHLPRTMGGRILLVAFAQTLVLAAIVGDRALALAFGRELIVKTVPVDPRDLFRGDYVALSYGMSQIESGRLRNHRGFTPGDAIFVTLSPREDDWVPVAVTHHPPKASALKSGERFVRGTVDYVYEAPERSAQTDRPACPAPCTTVRVKYGIESYFIPEGQGRALENERNERRLSVVLAVRGDGRAAIKALQLDGKTLAREGLF